MDASQRDWTCSVPASSGHEGLLNLCVLSVTMTVTWLSQGSVADKAGALWRCRKPVK